VSKYIILFLLVIFQVLGDVWLSRGMRQVGGVSISNLTTLMTIGIQVLTNPWIVLGILFLIGALFLHLTAISRLDLSYVLPMGAFKYVLSAFCAWFILGENVSQTRWWGTGLISSGVLLVALGEAAKKITTQGEKGSHFPVLVPLSVPLALSSFGATILQSKALIAVVIMALAASTGDILLTAGMKQVGEVSASNLRSLLRLIRQTLTNPFIGLGVLCMAADFFLFIALLSWADLSLIMPLTALSYPLSILGSHYILKERLTAGRIAGTGLIAVGVALISLNAATA
jgi:bacterial/archaeal transporter family protein